MTLQNRVTPLGELVAEPGAGARLRQPGLPARRRGAHPPALQRQALDRLPPRVPRLAPRRRCCSPDASRSSSSSTRRRPSPPGTGPARSAGARTTSASPRFGTSFTPARSAPTRSTRSSTPSASIPARGPSATTGGARRASRRCVRPAGRRGRCSCSARSCYVDARRVRATPRRAGRRRRRS